VYGINIYETTVSQLCVKIHSVCNKNVVTMDAVNMMHIPFGSKKLKIKINKSTFPFSAAEAVTDVV